MKVNNEEKKLPIIIRVLLYGLEKSGKSTLINSFQKGIFTQGIPSTAQNSYEITINKNVIFNILEVGGRKEVRKFVSELIDYVDAIIFVIDGSNERSFDEVTTEFEKIVNHPQSIGKPLAVLFHKNDITKIPPSIIIGRLDLLDRYDRPHQVFSSTAKRPQDFEQVLTWISKCLREAQIPIQDKLSRFLKIYILDMLNTKKEGFPILAILGQLEIISRTGQIEYNRDKIMVILRKLLTAGEVEYIKANKIWRITEKGQDTMSSSRLIKSGRYEEIRAMLDTYVNKSSSVESTKTGLDKDQKEILDDYDLDELAELYKKTDRHRRKD